MACAALVKATESEDGTTSRQPEAITEIEARILEGIAAGSSSAPLASRLYMSRQDIEYHVSGRLRKFHVPNRSAPGVPGVLLGSDVGRQLAATRPA